MLQLIVILSAHRTYTSAFLRLPSADLTFMPVSEGERSVLQATVPQWPSRSFHGQRRLFATLQELALRLSKSSVAPEVRPNSLLHRSKTCKACEAAACLTGSSLADCSLGSCHLHSWKLLSELAMLRWVMSAGECLSQRLHPTWGPTADKMCL